MQPEPPSAAFSHDLKSLLAPHDPAEFLADYWDNAPFLVQRNSPAHYGALLSLSDVDTMLNDRELHMNDLRLARSAEVIDSAAFTRANGSIDIAAVYALYADGATIILQHVHKSHRGMARLCRRLSHQLGMPFQTNLYLTPPSQQGFKPHYDSHDVFLLQIAGSKDWEVGGDPVRLPLKGQPFNPEQHEFGETRMAFRLGAGDMLYLPRGVMHQGKTTGETSLHITVGVQAYTWSDLILEAISQVFVQDERFRRALPVGFGVGEFDAGAARLRFGKLMDILRDQTDITAATGQLRREFISREPPRLAGQLSELATVSDLGQADPVRCRPEILSDLVTVGEVATLIGNGRELEFPARLESAIAFALSGETVRATDLPSGLDDLEKLEVVRQLVREGFLVKAAGS